MCGFCPIQGLCFQLIKPSSGIDPLAVFTFRCCGPWESCFPLQTGSGLSYPHPCAACAASCQQRGSLLAGLFMECREKCPQWLLTVSPARLTCQMSNIPCNNRKMSPLLHPTLLILEQTISLLEEELPTANRQLAAHAGLLSGRHPCLWPACLSGTEGTVDAALGTHNQKHGWGKQQQVDEQPQGSSVHWIGLRTVQDVCNYAALCWLQHREQIQLQMLLLLEFKWIL